MQHTFAMIRGVVHTKKKRVRAIPSGILGHTTKERIAVVIAFPVCARARICAHERLQSGDVVGGTQLSQS